MTSWWLWYWCLSAYFMVHYFLVSFETEKNWNVLTILGTLSAYHIFCTRVNLQSPYAFRDGFTSSCLQLKRFQLMKNGILLQGSPPSQSMGSFRSCNWFPPFPLHFGLLRIPGYAYLLSVENQSYLPHTTIHYLWKWWYAIAKNKENNVLLPGAGSNEYVLISYS